MSFVKNIVFLICLIFEYAAATELCPASGHVETVLNESPLFRDVKPKSQSLKEMTTPGRSHCAVNCYHRTGCRSIFYSTTDNVCLLYGEEVFHSVFENNPGMRRFRKLHVENDVPADCYNVVKKGIQADGVYLVQPRDGGQPVSVYCEISNGGWLVFQRRTDGSEDFYRTWNEYKDGFGNLSNEFWLGNTNIHRLTTQGLYELRVDLEDFEGNTSYSSYKNFSIAGEEKIFQLSVSDYSGSAGDGLSVQSGSYFSTKDKERDTYQWNCALDYKAGWWFYSCSHSSLNGMYKNGTKAEYTSVWWYPWRKRWYQPLKGAVMKIRPSKIVP